MIITAEVLNDVKGVRHAFFTRRGGVSRGLYAGLNCGAGSDDKPAAVTENRRRAMARLGLGVDDLRTVYQVHGFDVLTVTEAVADSAEIADKRPRADALVTATPGVALGVLTADCAPVLLADGGGGVIGAAHAGWRGALAGVTDAVIEAMIDLGATRSDIRAVVGPCIAQDSYEVGPEFPAAFLDEDPGNKRFFRPAERAGHFMFDLDDYVHMRIAEAGIYVVQSTALDTLADEQKFYSYRRTTQRNEPDYGRQLSAITISPALH